MMKNVIYSLIAAAALAMSVVACAGTDTYWTNTECTPQLYGMYNWSKCPNGPDNATGTTTAPSVPGSFGG